MFAFGSKARRFLAARMESVAETKGCTDRDFEILALLERRGTIGFGEAVEAMRQELQHAKGTSDAAIAAALSRLADRGLVKAVRTAADERKKDVSLLARGKKALKKRDEIRSEMIAKAVQAMSPTSEERRVLKAVYEKGLKNADHAFGGNT
jgi:DNA-binding MarR family transcriptional regulator